MQSHVNLSKFKLLGYDCIDTEISWLKYFTSDRTMFIYDYDTDKVICNAYCDVNKELYISSSFAAIRVSMDDGSNCVLHCDNKYNEKLFMYLIDEPGLFKLVVYDSQKHRVDFEIRDIKHISFPVNVENYILIRLNKSDETQIILLDMDCDRYKTFTFKFDKHYDDMSMFFLPYDNKEIVYESLTDTSFAHIGGILGYIDLSDHRLRFIPAQNLVYINKDLIVDGEIKDLYAAIVTELDDIRVKILNNISNGSNLDSAISKIDQSYLLKLDVGTEDVDKANNILRNIKLSDTYMVYMR